MSSFADKLKSCLGSQLLEHVLTVESDGTLTASKISSLCDIFVANRDDTVVMADALVKSADSATAPHRPSLSIARDRPMWKNNPHRPGNINVVTVPDAAVESRPSDFDVASVNWIGCVKTNSRQSFECAEFDEQCDDGKPQSRRYRDLLVNDVKVTCTSDSGSQICLVRRSVVGENVAECGKIVIQTFLVRVCQQR